MHEHYRSVRPNTNQAIENGRTANIFKDFLYWNANIVLTQKLFFHPKQISQNTIVHTANLILKLRTEWQLITRSLADANVRSLKSSRSAGLNNISPEFKKCCRPVQWIFVLIQRIWKFSCDLSTTGRLTSSHPKESRWDKSFRPICLLTSIYKLYAILVFQKERRVKDFVSWTPDLGVHTQTLVREQFMDPHTNCRTCNRV